MHDGTQGNAMTEIALAMAMGFFSVMVLTMMSMGVGVIEKPSFSAALVAPPAGRSAAPVEQIGKDDLVVVFDGARYLGPDLRPLAPLALARARRVILAVPPELPMAAVLKARAGVANANLVVTTLDARWQQALKERSRGR